jgi:aminoglycoside 3-N-acetyltransferase
MDGFILLLGVTHAVNTTLHMVEEVAQVPYHLQEAPALSRVAREDGTWEEILTTLHAYGWDRNFPKVEPALRNAGAQNNGTVGRAPSRLIDAKAMRDLLVPLIERDPLYLLSDSARKRFACVTRP